MSETFDVWVIRAYVEMLEGVLTSKELVSLVESFLNSSTAQEGRVSQQAVHYMKKKVESLKQ